MATTMNAETGPAGAVWQLFPSEQSGPVIRIQLSDQASVVLLRNLFQRVGDLGFPIDVAREPGMRLIGVSELILRRSEHAQKKTLAARNGRLLWEGTREQWFTAAEMLEPFRRGQTGHQYLTREEVDDVLVEVSYGEI